MASWPGEWLLSNDRGGQLGPWQLECAIRAARVKVRGLPDGFRYHLRHYLASLLWPGKDESTRAAIDAVLAARAEQIRNTGSAQ